LPLLSPASIDSNPARENSSPSRSSVVEEIGTRMSVTSGPLSTRRAFQTFICPGAASRDFVLISGIFDHLFVV